MKRTIALVGLSVALRLLANGGAAPYAVPGGDSPTYLHVDLGRPPTVPLLYAALGDDLTAIMLAQVLLAGLCWGLLAAAVASILTRPWLRLAGAAVVLAFSLSEEIVLWDRVILSESLSLSLLAGLVAAGLWWRGWLSRPSPSSGPAPETPIPTRWRW